MEVKVGPEVGDIVLHCGHKCEDGRLHYYHMRGVNLAPVEVDGVLQVPTWAVLCTSCHMDPRATSEKIRMWFQWEEEFVSPRKVVAN